MEEENARRAGWERAQMIMENCRLGGRIQEKPGWNERRHSDGGIWTKPHLLNNQVLKKGCAVRTVQAANAWIGADTAKKR
jgi:hypothetical protein